MGEKRYNVKNIRGCADQTFFVTEPREKMKEKKAERLYCTIGEKVRYIFFFIEKPCSVLLKC